MATLTLKKSTKLLILLGSLCVSPLSFSEALVATSVQSGEATAAALTRNYYDTAVNCGAATAPAFLCTGVVARTTNAGNFDPWDHSEFSRTSGAVSFSYLRADAKFGGAPWGNNEARHGYIFYPTLRAPQGKIRPSIICYFPYDGATIYRSKPGARGCRDSITQFVYPLSKPCNEQNIFTARAWLTHFRRVSYGNPASCAWMLNDALNEQAVANFNAGLQVRKLVELEAGAPILISRITTSFASKPGQKKIRLRCPSRRFSGSPAQTIWKPPESTKKNIMSAPTVFLSPSFASHCLPAHKVISVSNM